jgi:transposase
VSRQFGGLWTFLLHAGVEPTNNVAERELRGAVIARGPMLSTNSEVGRLLFTQLLSVSATYRKQGRDFLDFLRVTLERLAQNLPPPTLVPT